MSARQLIEVAFKGNRREFFLWPFEDLPAVKTPVIVDADRGEDLGLVHATGELAAQRKAGTTHGKTASGPLRRVLRAATRDEIARGASLRADEHSVRKNAIETARSQGLDMKVSDTEWQWDKKKLTIYFTAEKRVDFRSLVRDLEALFSTRVQMWHIGARDEAKRLDGVGRCARQYCSAGWLPELRPIKSSLAKDQRLSTLNPAQISGSCGRLMCCLRHEHDFYVQQRKRFPKEGRVLVTALGEEKVVGNDIFREQVTLRTVTGETRILALSALQIELGSERLSTTVEHHTAPDEGEVTEDEAAVPLFVAIERASPRPMRPPSQSASAGTSRPSSRSALPRTSRASSHSASPEPSRPSAPSASAGPSRVPTQSAPPKPEPSAHPSAHQAPHPSESAAEPAAAAARDDEKREGRRRRRGRRGGRRGRDKGGGAPSAPGAPES